MTERIYPTPDHSMYKAGSPWSYEDDVQNGLVPVFTDRDLFIQCLEKESFFSVCPLNDLPLKHPLRKSLSPLHCATYTNMTDKGWEVLSYWAYCFVAKDSLERIIKSVKPKYFTANTTTENDLISSIAHLRGSWFWQSMDKFFNLFFRYE